MQGFIEVTNYENGKKVLVSISNIISVMYNDDGIVFIETWKRGDKVSIGILASESYVEIKNMLRIATR